jgi:hypothetical protein
MVSRGERIALMALKAVAHILNPETADFMYHTALAKAEQELDEMCSAPPIRRNQVSLTVKLDRKAEQKIRAME